MIQIQNLKFGYTKKSLLFDNLDLSLKKGHIYGLLGKNGAGKSTLLKNIIGLVFPHGGSCLVNGINTSGRPVSVLENLFFLPEDIYVPALTPKQFVSNTGCFYPKFNESEFEEHLKVLEIDPQSRMDRLSYGQQKKVMIAFGLATNTGILIMDEPTNGLDIPSKAQFRKIMVSALSEERCIIISTHQVRDLDNLIDSLVVLHNREVVLNMAVDKITEKISFGTFTDTSGLPVLYEEESFRGKSVILRNTKGNYSKIDLELLFNALTTNNQYIIELLNQAENE